MIYTPDLEISTRAFGALSDVAKAARLSKISRGATDWVEIVMHDSVASGVAALRAAGFETLVATTPNACDAVGLYDERAAVLGPDGAECVDWARTRVALLFGAEGAGISDELFAAADTRLNIPQRGMTQSLNVAMSSAIVLSEVLRRRGPSPPTLDALEIARLELALLPNDGKPFRLHNKAHVKQEALRHKRETRDISLMADDLLDE